MNILLAMVPLSLVLLGVAIWAFLRALRGGQFDDLDTPPLDMLGDDARPRPVGRHGPRDRDGADGAPREPGTPPDEGVG